MKIKSLILAFPVLCLACSNPSTPSDPASQMDASPLMAKRVAGVRALATDFSYEEPCTILGEEYVRSALNLEETTKLEETIGHEGCEFTWEGNKVVVSFVGTKPFASVYTADYMFDKMFVGKKPVAAEPEPAAQAVQTTTSAEGATPNATAVIKADSTGNMKPEPAEAAPAPEGAAAMGMMPGKPVANLGDKAVWDEAKGALHVLYQNNIINVTVSTKGKPEMREEQAKSMAEVLIEKIAENEYTKKM